MRIPILVLALLVASCLPTSAAPISILGTLDPEDPNDVFLLQINVATAGNVAIQSFGYGGGVNAAGTTVPGGGFDGYLSLFSGIGPSALFLASDDDGGCPPAAGAPCGDPRLSLALAPGLYTVALGTFLNMSFAENYGTGVLGDGFIGLGSYFDWHTYTERTPAFALDVDGAEPHTPIPEPSILVLLGTGAVAVWRSRRGPRGGRS